MKGLELAEKYYKEYGEPMLKEQFPDVLSQIAVGLIGSGSECFGYDDEISEDHDFEPGFTIFIPSEPFMDSKTAFRLERAYAKLPKEFMGFKRPPVNPVGGNRHGVVRLDEFLTEKLGNSLGELSATDWLRLPEVCGEDTLRMLRDFAEARKDLLGGVLLGSVGQLGIRWPVPVAAGPGVPVMNRGAARFLKEQGASR